MALDNNARMFIVLAERLTSKSLVENTDPLLLCRYNLNRTYYFCSMASDIAGRAHIETLLRAFYGAARADALLGPIFAEAVPEERWEVHIQKVADFWETVLFAVPRYRGSPFLPHLKLSLSPEHFERWFQLFRQTVEAHFEGPNAARAIEAAHKMAILFASKYEYYKAHPQEKPLV